MAKISKGLFLVAIFMLLLSSCGEDGPEDSLRSSTNNLLSAASERNWEQFCDQLTEESQKNLVVLLGASQGDNCPQSLASREKLVGARIAAEGDGAEIQKITIKGKTGSVVVRNQNGQENYPAKEENGQWKLDLFPSS